MFGGVKSLGQDMWCTVQLHYTDCLDKGAGRARLPEVDPLRRRWTVDVANALPVVDEVVPQTVAGIHPKDEVEEPIRPLL